MTIHTARPIARSLLAAGLAFVGTVLSFSVTTAHAATNHYSAKLASALPAPQSKVVNDVIWSCAGENCTAPLDGGRAINTCIKVAKTFGQLSSFTGPKGEFSAEDLQRCNAAA